MTATVTGDIVLAVGAVLFLVGLAAIARLGRLKEAHHLYWGLLLLLVGRLIPWPRVGLAVMILGVLLVADDAYQHAAQALGSRERMADFTPVHRVGAVVVQHWRNWRAAVRTGG